MAQWIKDKAPLKSGEYFVYLKHENDAPDDKPTRDSVEYIEKEGWHIGSGWAIVKWLDESESTPTTTVGGSVEERCPYELFVIKYFGLPEDVSFDKVPKVTYADFVSILALYSEQENSLPIKEFAEKEANKHFNKEISSYAWEACVSSCLAGHAHRGPAVTVERDEFIKKHLAIIRQKTMDAMIELHIVGKRELLKGSLEHFISGGNCNGLFRETILSMLNTAYNWKGTPVASQPPAPTVQGLDETLSLLNYIYGEAIGGKPLRADTMNRINQLTWKIRKGYQNPSNTEGQEEQEDLWDQVAGYIVTFTGSNKMEAVRVCESLKKIVSLSCVQK